MKKVTLKPAKEKSLLRKHPWVFSGAIKNVEKDTKDGSIVEIFSNKDKYLATGHYNEGNISVRVFDFERHARSSSSYCSLRPSTSVSSMTTGSAWAATQNVTRAQSLIANMS